VQTLTERHDGLRTVFALVGGEPKQKIISIRDFKLDFEEIDLRAIDKEKREQEAREMYTQVANRAFNLELGPLFRFRILRLEEKKYLLFFNIHHIVNDGWSQGNINNEIVILYNSFLKKSDHPLSQLYLQYKDYTLWHNDLIESGSFFKSREYWLGKFGDKPNGMDLPLDHSRKPVQTFNGGRVSFVVDAAGTAELHRLSLDRNVTLFMTLLALLDIFLAKYTGQEDIIIGAPIAARKRPELHPLVGFLVNTLVYRSRVNHGESFVDFLSAVKKETLSCFEYQDYPFDLLIEDLGLDRDLSQSPVFNVMLAHNNADTENIDLAMEGVVISDYAFREDFNMSKFDLIFFMDERADHVFIRIEYNSDLFERSTIERMAANFPVLVDNVIGNEDAPISKLNYISEEEYEKVLRAFNDNRYEFPGLSLRESVEEQAACIPGKIAVVGTAPKGSPTACPTITYGELNRRANRLAHYLKEEYGLKANDVAGVSMDRSIDMIVVLVAVVKSGAGYLAVDPTYPRERVLHVLSDSEAKLLIIDKKRPELLAGYVGEILDVLSVGKDIDKKSPENPGVVNRPSDILYVNYTSGSTGTPNGAMLSHDCLTNLIHWQNETTSIDCSLRVLQFTSINFCVSFQEIMGALTKGGELHLIGDVERQDIDYLLDFLSSHQIEILFLPFSYLNFLFNESGRWDRSFDHKLKHIITAGEQLKITAGLKRFLDLNPGLQLHNHYGSTEMHVVTSYTLAAATAEKTPIPPAGKPINNVSIYILDENLNPAAVGVWGEIFVKGSSEILGYINNEALTEEKLVRHPELSVDGARLYRSGDIGRWQTDGNIELRGRKDFQVKIRGFRVEPGEIESKILAIGYVRECVVVVKEDTAGLKYLVAYVVTENIEAVEIKKILGNDMPQYMLPQLVLLKSLPLMPNGKVDRERLPEPEFEKQEDYTAPRDRMEAALVEIWAELLAVEKERIGIDGNFFELGGHSLKATLMVSRIQKRFDKRIPLTEIFRAPTIRELAGYIRAAQADEYTAVEPAKPKDYYPLSAAQKRLFILYEIDKNITGYNMPTVMVMAGELDKERLTDTSGKLIVRHESLRTSFHRIDEEPVQRIHKPEDFKFEIEYYEAGNREQEAEINEIRSIIDRFIRPFDLSAAPLLRIGLIPLENRTHIFMVDMHHIISDGTSMGIMTRDFMALYGGKELAPLKVQYKDFSEWQNSAAEKEKISRQEEYWLRQFTGAIPALDLPYDFSRPPLKSYEGGTISFEINEEETAALNHMALEQGATLYMVLLAIYYIFLKKISGREDIVIGTPTAGRRHADLEPIIGMFINTLCLRNYSGKGESFSEFLQEVKVRTLGAFENQDYRLEDLIEKIDVNRETSRNPLFDVMFSLQNMDITEIKIPGLKLIPYEYENKTSKFDLILMGFEVADRLFFSLQYSSKLFKKEKIERFAGYFKDITTVVLADVDVKLDNINIASGLITPESEISQEFDGEFGF
jgi:amino acid adenylation domain-containing protein